MTNLEFGVKSPIDQLNEFGINPYLDLKRYQFLTQKFGHLGLEIFIYEQEKNLLFRREFIDDLPYSFANIAFLINGKLYTQKYDKDDTFLIERMIDPNERNGLTLEGYRKFQRELSLAEPEEVVLWYSPAWVPNDNSGYDSGRLYISFKTAEGINISFDVKVLEDLFPIASFLNFVNPKTDNPNEAYFYLTRPFRTGYSIANFLDLMEKTEYNSSRIYVQHRLPNDPREKKSYYLRDIAQGIRKELTKMRWQLERLEDLTAKLNRNFFDPIGDKTIGVLAREEDQLKAIAYAYWQELQRAAEETGGTLFLYGCSARGEKNFNNKYSAYFQSVSGSIYSLFDSMTRGFITPPSEYSFDHEGICVVCHQGPKALGPCDICEECDKKLQNENVYQANY